MSNREDVRIVDGDEKDDLLLQLQLVGKPVAYLFGITIQHPHTAALGEIAVRITTIGTKDNLGDEWAIHCVIPAAAYKACDWLANYAPPRENGERSFEGAYNTRTHRGSLKVA